MKATVVEAYLPQTDTWSPKRHMPTARFWQAAAALEGRVYVFAGGLKSTETLLPDLEVFDPYADNSLRLAHMAQTAPDRVLVEFQGYPGHRYRILSRSDPSSGRWRPGTICVAQSGVTQVGLALPAATRQVFVRIEEID